MATRSSRSSSFDSPNPSTIFGGPVGMARNPNQVPNSKIAVYPGSFDPFTNGHLDVVDRALAIFDKVIVAVAANPDKRQPLFTVEERVQLIQASLESRDRAEVSTYTGLTVEYAR